MRHFPDAFFMPSEPTFGKRHVPFGASENGAWHAPIRWRVVPSLEDDLARAAEVDRVLAKLRGREEEGK